MSKDLSTLPMIDLPSGFSFTQGFTQDARSPFESYENQILNLKASLKDKEEQIKYLEEMIDELEKHES